MSRKRSTATLTHLLDVATGIFIDQGYRGTQMDDVARAARVAKGTLYRYFESKDALFDAVLRAADGRALADLPEHLPLPTPGPSDTLRYLEKRAAEEIDLPELTRALSRAPARATRGELECIIREYYVLIRRNRASILLLDRCAQDHPRLARAWHRAGRDAVQARLVRYLAKRQRGRSIRSDPPATITARILIDTVSSWAVGRTRDPSRAGIADSEAADALVAIFVTALVRPRGRGE